MIFADALPSNTTVTVKPTDFYLSIRDWTLWNEYGIFPTLPPNPGTPAWAPPMLTYSDNSSASWSAFHGNSNQRETISVSLTTDAAGTITAWDLRTLNSGPGGSTIWRSTPSLDYVGEYGYDGSGTVTGRYNENSPGPWSVTTVANPLPGGYVPPIQAVPEPESLAMLMAGLGMLAGARAWRGQRASRQLG
jgi:hypothetical protein